MYFACHQNHEKQMLLAQVREKHEVILRAVTIFEQLGKNLEESKAV